MFNPQSQTEKTGLEKAIDKVLLEMNNHPNSDSDEFKKMTERLTQLYALQKMTKEHELKGAEALANQQNAEIELELKRKTIEADCRLKDIEAAEKMRALDHPWRPSAETLAIVAGNLAGIAVIVLHERAHVVTSKALAFVMKAR